MKLDRDTFILATITSTFVALIGGCTLLWSFVPNVGMALLAASPLCLLIQLNAWADAHEQDDSQANWRW